MALSDVVGSVLDGVSGVTATALLPLLHHAAVLIGTNKGSVLFCTASAESTDLLEPSCDVTLHCGPVYDMALSTQHLVATAGHDAVSCVFPLHALFSTGGLTNCRRLSGQTFPVVAVRFLSDGTTLISLGADGQVRVVDVVGGDVLAVLSVGFAATCLSCTVDETVLFVGGRCLAAMDLYDAMRPTSSHADAAIEAWKPVPSTTLEGTGAVGTSGAATASVRFYQWASPCAGGDAATTTQVTRTPPGTMISKLLVDNADGTLTALFMRRTMDDGPVQICGEAQWAAGGGKTACKTSWAEAGERASAELQQQQQRRQRRDSRRKETSVRCRVRSEARPSAKQPLQTSLPLPAAANGAAALWQGRWYASPFDLTTNGALRLAFCGFFSCSAASLVVPRTSNTVLAGSTEAAPLTRGEQVALAEVHCNELQRECDALVFQLRSLRSVKGKLAAA
jgi:hypothetical protein